LPAGDDINYNKSVQVKMTALQIILVVLGATVFLLLQVLVIRKWHREPAPAFLGRFLDSDFRRWLQLADKVIARSGIEPAMTIMELGCGSWSVNWPGRSIRVSAISSCGRPAPMNCPWPMKLWTWSI
jgi:hypothetical protein